MYIDQCMPYLNHILLSCLWKSQPTKGITFDRLKVADLRDPNAEVNSAYGAVCESVNVETEAQLASSKGKKRKHSQFMGV